MKSSCRVETGEAESCWECECAECKRLQQDWHDDNPQDGPERDDIGG